MCTSSAPCSVTLSILTNRHVRACPRLTPSALTIAPSRLSIWTCLTQGSLTQDHTPNAISIDSVFLAKVTAEHSYTLQSWVTHFPLKIALSHGGSGPHLIHGSFGPPESSFQSASHSACRFCTHSYQYELDNI